ncbi:hypothetical protein SanaruYs_00990 [Chryseotalea sanaruensis]|uniref:NmrA-like domain-containing protein n=1 Tax=Chryseotalea sanaruensis TaxID=2482724 RepID=A0A401U4U6_9BACT|nr:hypothetical protein SanaruYs_00990 [Chryseotalea sanaruensis]
MGLPFTQAFVKHRYEVSALIRNAAKASKLLPENVQIVNGDIADPGSLEKFLDQTEYLYLNLNLQQHEKLNEFHTEAEGL